VDSIQADFDLSPAVLGFTVAITLLGCAAGAWLAGGLADRWGRKKVMVAAAFLFAINSAGSAYAFSAWDLMAWRLIGGLAIGAASVIVPGYIAEIAPSKWRGGLASVQQLAITVGIFAALLSDASLANAAGGAGNEFWWGFSAWRWMLLVGVIPAVIYGVLALIIPESPHFIIRAGRDEEAARVLSRVAGVGDTTGKISQIRMSFEREDRASYRDLRGPAFGLQPILWVGMAIAALQQLVGINAIFYYSTTLWRSVGFSESDSFTTSVITSIINVAMTFVATWGPVMWVTLGEMFPNRIRSIALGVATMVNWVFNFIVTLTFPWVSENLGLWIMYAAFTVFAVFSFIFVRTKLPEFAGKDLEDNGELASR